MKHRHLMSLSAVALTAFALAGGPVAAQEAQLESSVGEGLASLGIGTDQLDTLSVEQLIQIESVLNSGDSSDEKADRIERIIASTDDTPAVGLGVAQLEDSVRAAMNKLGVSTENVPMLSLSELAQIEAIVGSGDDDDSKRRRVEQIVAR